MKDQKREVLLSALLDETKKAEEAWLRISGATKDEIQAELLMLCHKYLRTKIASHEAKQSIKEALAAVGKAFKAAMEAVAR